jgi:hypothetical protein
MAVFYLWLRIALPLVEQNGIFYETKPIKLIDRIRLRGDTCAAARITNGSSSRKPLAAIRDLIKRQASQFIQIPDNAACAFPG